MPNGNIEAQATPLYLNSFMLPESSLQGDNTLHTFIYYNLLVVTYFMSISLYSMIIFYFISLQHIFDDSSFNLFPHHSQYSKAPPSACQHHHYTLDHILSVDFHQRQYLYTISYLLAQLLFFDCLNLKM